MPDYQALASSLTTPEAFYALSDENAAFGVKKQSRAALELWHSSQERFVGPCRALRAPGGEGSGFVIFLYWDASQVSPDLDAIDLAINTELPVRMIQVDEKTGWNQGRDKKQSCFFRRQGIFASPTCQWLRQRFGVYGYPRQVLGAGDFEVNTAAVCVKDGLDHVWVFQA
ncbi:MAG: hypothetical protein LBK42_07395 [Propionibacteriaceae bacterium]|jgi:hypothetical protein|nr:hypothetical protein [Propionibacteriaceae bacterium]